MFFLRVLPAENSKVHLLGQVGVTRAQRRPMSPARMQQWDGVGVLKPGIETSLESSQCTERVFAEIGLDMRTNGTYSDDSLYNMPFTYHTI